MVGKWHLGKTIYTMPASGTSVSLLTSTRRASGTSVRLLSTAYSIKIFKISSGGQLRDPTSASSQTGLSNSHMVVKWQLAKTATLPAAGTYLVKTLSYMQYIYIWNRKKLDDHNSAAGQTGLSDSVAPR
jgi:hypothetical protein